MPFFQNVRRAPASECGAKKVFVTTKAGVKIWLDPHSEASGRPVCLDIPSGRKFMRKLISRFRALEKSKKFVDITQVRGMVKYLANVREQHGVKVAKAVRLLSSQLLNGFEVVAMEKGSVHEKLNLLGIKLTIDGRKVTIRDLEGEYSYQDDYYYTFTKYALLDVLQKYEINLTLVDQRDRHSVEKVFGDKSDKTMVEKFSTGEYVKNRVSKLWGGVGADRVRKVAYNRDIKIAGREVKILRLRERKPVDWTNARSRKDWLDVFEQIMSHNFDKKKTEQLKMLMGRNQFTRVRNRLKRMGAFEILRSRRVLAECVYDALLVEVGYDPPVWVSFVVRGCNNLLRYQGDRYQQLVHASDTLSTVSSDSSGESFIKCKMK